MPDQIPPQYSKTLLRLINWLLSIDPDERPDIVQVMAHHWCFPPIHKLPTCLGAVPLTNTPDSPLGSKRNSAASPFPELRYSVYQVNMHGLNDPVELESNPTEAHKPTFDFGG